MLKKTVMPKAMKKRATKNVANVLENDERIVENAVMTAEMRMTGFLPILK